MDPVENYFDSVSLVYKQRSSAAPWCFLRTMESRKILRALEKESPKKILEIGCGAGYYTRLLRKKFPASSITCLDKSTKMLQQIDVRVDHKISGNFLHFQPQEKYDFVFAVGVLEFVEDPLAFFLKMENVLTAGASGLLFFPSSSFLAYVYRAFHAKNGIRIQLFSRSRILKLCEQANLRPLLIKNVRPFSTMLVAKKFA